MKVEASARITMDTPLTNFRVVRRRESKLTPGDVVVLNTDEAEIAVYVGQSYTGEAFDAGKFFKIINTEIWECLFGKEPYQVIGRL